MVNTDLSYTTLAKRDVSFQLIRTNPKLTTNLKITVDSAGSIWFNSINANEQLTDQKYKRFPINEASSHEVNIHKFYDSGKTPSSIAYSVGSTIRKDAVAKNLKEQYDFDLYTSGAKYLTSRQYSEKFSYFAPIYLDSILPSKFVIFKIPGVSNYTAGEGMEKSMTNTQADFATDLFKNATIVKVIDLGPTSKIGKYIQNIVNNQFFDKNPLYVNFKNGGYSLYRGASISAGTYVEIPERLDTIFSRSLPLLSVEQFITNGYERHSVVHPRILNLEFLFNDETSNDYTFNRYFGFYCNEIDLDNIEIDLPKMYQLTVDDILENEQGLPTKYQQSDDIQCILTNPNGVTLRATSVNQDLRDIGLNRTSSRTLFFPYLKTKDSNLHLIAPNSWEQSGTAATFKVDDTSFDLGQTFGPDELIAQENVIQSITNVRSTIQLTIATTPNHLDTIRLYHPTGTKKESTDSAGYYDDIKLIRAAYSIFPNNEPYKIDHLTTGSQIYVNADRELNQIAQAICDLTFELNNSSIFSIRIDNSVFIQVREFGDKYGELKLKIISSYVPATYLINGKVTNDLVFADGGFFNRAHPIIPTGNSVRLDGMLNDVVVKTFSNWSTINRISNCADYIKGELSIEKQAEAISNYSKYEVLMLTDNETINSNYNKIEIRKLFKPAIGVLSIFEIKDFDFSTHTTSYSRNLLIDIYKDFYIPANLYLVDFTKYVYKVIGQGTIDINGNTYSNSDQYIWQNSQSVTNYTILSGDPILIKTQNSPLSADVSTRLDIGYFDENGDARNYIGPFALKAYHAAQSTNSETYPYRDKFLYGNLASEYDAYLENYTTAFASESRVTPYISKWGIMDATDSRDNTYRLNSDILFGKNNFSPSHNETIANPEKMTHEWFYVESEFDYINEPTLIKNNFSYFSKTLIVDDLISDDTYFDYYFTYIPRLLDLELGRPQYRYSTLSKNQFTGQYETILKGAKLIFTELDKYGKILSSTNRFNGYRFSAILKPIKEDAYVPRQPVKYRVIENTNNKTITLVIELVIGSINSLSPSMLINGWNGVNGNTIDQNSLFNNYYVSSSTEYSEIRTDITVSGLSQYNAMVNGNSPIMELNPGETAALEYSGKTTIIATEGSQIYNDFLIGKISTGDIISQTGTGIVTDIGTIIISTGLIKSVKLKVDSVVSVPFTLIHNTSYLDASLGDYRISFNEKGVCDLTHSFLYYAKNKKYNSSNNAFSTIKLSRGVNLSSSGVIKIGTQPISINPVNLYGINSYEVNADSEINSVVTGFKPIYVISSNRKQILVETVNGSPVDLADSQKTKSGIIGANSQSILLDQNPNFTYNLATQIISVVGGVVNTTYSISSIPSQSSGFWSSSLGHFQIFGGNGYFEKLFENLSFAKFIKILEKNPELVSWESYFNGKLSNYQAISMSAQGAEEIAKSTVNQIDSITVTSDQINGIAGFKISEVPTSEYSIYRYSGEYDVIFKPITGFNYSFIIGENLLNGLNCCINPNIDNFFNITDFEYVKYSTATILSLENSQNYAPEYPYIGETPIDRTNFNVLSSSWDSNYHFEYLDKKTAVSIPGTRRIFEDYSFVSKLLNCPSQFTVESFIFSEVSATDYLSSNFGTSNFIYSTFGNEVRFKIDIRSIIANHLIDNGLLLEFQKFFKYADGSDITSDTTFLGELSFTDYLIAYCYANLINLYQIGTFDFYELEDRTILGNLVKFNKVSYQGLAYLEYSQAKTVKINNTKSTIIEGSVQLKPSTGLQIVPKLKINFI